MQETKTMHDTEHAHTDDETSTCTSYTHNQKRPNPRNIQPQTKAQTLKLSSACTS